MLPQVEELATVVVCEDDDPTRELLCDQLTADRYRALPAPSASDALRLCGYNHPDLMLLDLGLPDAPGIDVLREIRSSGERFDPELPVLVLSGRSSEADRLRGLRPGPTISFRTIIRCGSAGGGSRPRRQPGGFEGVGGLGKDSAGQSLAVAQRPELPGADVDLGLAALGLRAKPENRHNLIPAFGELLRQDAPFVKRSEPLLEVPLDFLAPSIGARPDPRWGDQFDIWALVAKRRVPVPFD
jgi:CheY-like chemotaxis protein